MAAAPRRAGAGGTPVDLLAGFGLPIASRTIAGRLGLADADLVELTRLSSARFDLDGWSSGPFSDVSESGELLLGVVRRERRRRRRLLAQRRQPGPAPLAAARRVRLRHTPVRRV